MRPLHLIRLTAGLLFALSLFSAAVLLISAARPHSADASLSPSPLLAAPLVFLPALLELAR